RSRCPMCGAGIAWRDNLPVVGWLLLRGRARCCRQRISVRYPLVEALTALLFFCAAHWPHSGSPFDEDAEFFWPRMFAAAFSMVFLAFLVASTFIDWDHRILPDALNIPCSVIGCTLVPLMAPGYAGELSNDPPSPGLDSLLASLCGLLAGFLLTWAIRAGAR